MAPVLCIFLFLALDCCVSSAPNSCPISCDCRWPQHVTSCRSGKLESIPWNLPDPSGLLELDMRDNKVQILAAPITLYPNLKILDLRYNNLVRIERNIFIALNKLQALLLLGNRLQQLSSRVFQGLRSLQLLDLSSNQIETLGQDVFYDLEELENLNLGSNRLSRLEEDTFRNLGKLRYLTLSDNFIYQFPPLEGLFKLSSIYLDMNRIKIIPSSILKSALNVQLVSLNGNLISRIADDAFSADTVGCIRIERLYLRDNLLLGVPREAMGCLEDLQVLDLSGNLMEFFTDSDFKGLLRLDSLVLSNMPRLKSIRNGTFSSNYALRELIINSNRQLSSVERGSFGVANRLRRLDLHGNSLVSLDHDLLNWNSLEFLDLRFNSWICDCQLQWLCRKIETIGVNESRFRLMEARCSSPQYLFSRRVADLNEADMVCVSTITAEQLQRENEDKILFALLGATCSVLFVIMIFVVFKYRDSFLNPSSGTYPYASYIYPSFRHPDIHPSRVSQQRQHIRAIQANQEISQSRESSENLTQEPVTFAKGKKSEVRFKLDEVMSS